ncbi:multidrug efflux SMR transporter [Okeania sp.]|uniref:DMT family transporter n=1 Tax=Okeania sp. TaxID=3100323 RepID=UPI002B4AB244|nr:multidrug efflux SMR transporter [Okeania sp.]MEB3343644.1 multidrug efflux SMR transporter [Okeania sp.]
MAWIYLMIAVGCEIIWAISLKATAGYSELWPSVFNASVLTINIYFLSRAVKTLPVAVAYPIWTGLGGAGVAIAAVVFFHESLGIWQIICILAIILGVIGLEIGKPKENEESLGSVESLGSLENG